MNASTLPLDLGGLLTSHELGPISCVREGTGARWICGDRSALVTFQDGGRLEASFVDAAVVDEATGTPVRCAYRSKRGASYDLTHADCSRMVDDMSAFFAGAREPLFTFVGMHAGQDA